MTAQAPVSDGADEAGLPRHAGVAIVGTGFAGLGMAIALKNGRHHPSLRSWGEPPFVVLERAADVGGTWRDNSYPGCTCDVPSNLYSFSFAPNPSWSRSFSHQPEIYRYLQRTADEAGILPHMRFDAEMLDARWDEIAQRWSIRTSRGDLTADVLVTGTGGLSDPKLPAIPGVETFAGTTFHSATWRHDHPLTGERVAVIGTGASAIQFVPHVQREAARLMLFQRTAPWVLPRSDRDISRVEHWLFRRVPPLQRAIRTSVYWGRESWILGFSMKLGIIRLAEKLALRHMYKQVRDPELRLKLTPNFRLGCKRVLLSNDYYPALTQPNVDVITDRIAEILPHSVVTVDAKGIRTEHPVDTIIFGTGFRATDLPIAHRLRGRGGKTLAEYWAEVGMSALNGLAVAGFPNLFLLYGPNTGSGHTSVVFMIESQVRYVLDLLRQMEQQGIAAVEPRPEIQTAFNERLQQQFAGTVWSVGGCASWYLDKRGKNTTLWPTFSYRFHQKLRRCDLSDYAVHHRSSQRATIGAEATGDTRLA